MDQEVPKYEVMQTTIISPHRLDPGAVIATWGPPGPHLHPLNAAAQEMMEAWYQEEHILYYTDETGQPRERLDHTGQVVKWKPHLKYKPASYAPVEEAEFVLVAPPPKPGMDDVMKTLAAVNIKGPTTDLRPPPAFTPRRDLEPELDFAGTTAVLKPGKVLSPRERAEAHRAAPPA